MLQAERLSGARARAFLALLTLLLATGCGGGPERSGDPTDPARPSSPTPATAPDEPTAGDAAAAVPGAILGNVSMGQGPAFEYVAQVMRVDGVGEHLTAITDREGNFVIEEVPPGTYLMTVSDLYAFKTGWIRQRSCEVTVAPGEVLTEDFVFDVGVSVRGTFSGAPIPANRVQVQLLRSGAPQLTGTAIRDTQHQIGLATHLEATTYVKPDGTFELLDVRPGSYEIRIRTFPERSIDRSLPWGPPEHVSPVEVEDEDVILDLVAN